MCSTSRSGRDTYKVFVGIHAKDVKEEVEEATTLVIENVAIDPIDIIKLFHFLSSKLMQIQKKRKEIIKEKKQLDTKNQNLGTKESNLQQLLAIISSQAGAPSKALTLSRQHSF